MFNITYIGNFWLTKALLMVIYLQKICERGIVMVLSQTIGCVQKFGDFRAVEMLARAGFDAIDYNLANIACNKDLQGQAQYKKYCAELLEKARANGVYFNQGHAVTYVACHNGEDESGLLCEANKKAIEISSLLGIKMLVVHPLSSGNYIGEEQKTFEMNGEYFKALLPYAEEYGVKLAVENMWCGNKRKGIRTGSVCSNPYEHAYYVDYFNNDMLVACLDVGHSSLAGREAQDCIRVLGKRLQALHIHDNDYLDDMHTLPGMSEMNWQEIMKALADISYKGDFTFETDHFFDSLETVEECECGLKLAELIGRRLIKNII